LDIRENLVLLGTAAANTTINANGIDRVIHVQNSAFAYISDVTVTGGATTDGGGLRTSTAGGLVLTDSIVTGNVATGAGGAIDNLGVLYLDSVRLTNNSADEGGAVENVGTARIVNSLIDHNTATNSGGGIQSKDGTSNLNVLNSTFSANAAANGGGLYLDNWAYLDHLTIADNSATTGGGFELVGGTFAIRNSIVANNTASTGADVAGAISSLGYNVIGTTSGSSGWVLSDYQNTDPKLSALADFGGPTLTYALLDGSVAIDRATPTSQILIDQRGEARSYGAGDAGAFEGSILIMPVIVDTTSDVSDGDTSSIAALYADKGADGRISLREAITATNNTANSGGNPDEISFQISASDAGYVDPTPGSPGSGDEYWTIALSSALPVITDGVVIDGTTQTGWVAGSFLPIIVDGNGNGGGLEFSATADNSVIRGLVIRDFNADAVDLLDGADNITVVGNFIGQFNSDGTDAGSGEANVFSGIRTRGDNTVVGGSSAAERNIISGNEFGVLVRGSATNVTISGNYIGTDVTGTGLVGANDYGVYFQDTANSSTVGGTTAAHGNVIAGAGINAIAFTSESNDSITIQHNIIGVSAAGTTLLDHNDGAGSAIYITGGGDSTQILNNVIAGARYAGIELDASGVSSGTVIRGNTIGTDATGTLNWGNGETGILIENATNTVIGGIGAGEGNVVAFSGVVDAQWGAAIAIQDGGTGNSVRGNSIYSNSLIGVDLSLTVVDGVTPNDTGDVDTGTNNLQNWAVLTAAGIADDGTFSYSLNTTTLSAGTYTIDFYASSNRDGGLVQGERYLGTLTGVASGNSSLSGTLSGITLASGEYVTLITTDASGNSSEFSNYAVAVDTDAGGATPSDPATVATSGGGLSLNEDGGNDAYLLADDGDAIVGGLGSLTAEIQFSSNDLSSGGTLLSYYTPTGLIDADDALLIKITSSGDLRFRINGSNATGGLSSAMDYRTLADGQRHSIAATWHNTAGAWEIFVDGISVDSGTGFRTGATISTGGRLALGQDWEGFGDIRSPSDAFHGSFYDVRLFDDVRTASEIQASYRSTLPYHEAGMLANWRFDDLSRDGVVTEAVSGNNLTVRHVARSGFTASTPTLTLSLDENSLDGTVVGSVSGSDAERDAIIASLLAADPELVYSAETGKFYKVFTDFQTWTAAESNAISQLLNGVSGQLGTIRSAAEQELFASFATAAGQRLWLGATDTTVEGEWRWRVAGINGDLFWSGNASGFAANGAYENWLATNPDDAGGQDYLAIEADGTWDDKINSPASGIAGRVVEWNADDVLDATQALTYSIQSQTVAGAFTIDSDTGEITVADGSLLDYESNTSHTLTIRTTDIDGNTFDKALTITLSDLAESNNAPTQLSSGIELN
ncbi:MAG: cadherin domain-containing protein, partial [Planctomycetaceae bacterium]|nr:cadherin domain-containing protein [Planctomycetaceae bacterium]